MESLGFNVFAQLFNSILNWAATQMQQHKEHKQQKDLLEDEQAFQAEREDISWQRQNAEGTYSDYLALGFNPNLAAQSVMGGNLETTTAESSPTAPSVNSAIGALSSMFNAQGQNLQDMFLKAAQVDNLRSQTNKNDVEAGIMPRDFMLRKLSIEKQLQVWDKSVDKMTSEIGYNSEMTDLVKQQNLFYGRKTEAEIQAIRAQTIKAFADMRVAMEQVNLMKHQEKELDAKTVLENAQTSNVIQDTSNKVIEGDLTYQKAERERIYKEFEAQLGPLTADAKDKIRGLIMEGKYDEAQQFYEVIFTSAENQSLGAEIGKPRFSLGGGMAPFNLRLFNNGAGLPSYNEIWNPNGKPRAW